MSADGQKPATTIFLTLLSGCAVVLPFAASADDAAPDMALLEYLGSWEESDEDWVLFEAEDEQAGQQEARSEPATADDAAQESQHES